MSHKHFVTGSQTYLLVNDLVSTLSEFFLDQLLKCRVVLHQREAYPLRSSVSPAPHLYPCCSSHPEAAASRSKHQISRIIQDLSLQNL